MGRLERLFSSEPRLLRLLGNSSEMVVKPFSKLNTLDSLPRVAAAEKGESSGRGSNISIISSSRRFSLPPPPLLLLLVKEVLTLRGARFLMRELGVRRMLGEVV